jgi:hypothetical protein
MLRVFIGYDPRQPISYNVLQQSIFTRSSKPVSITPLVIEQLPITRVGLTPFTYTRFLVPYLCKYEGWALFLDIDMLLQDDIAKLFDLANDRYTVMVSKNDMRFEWASAMLFNCSRCEILTPEFINDPRNDGLHAIRWAEPSEIGDLPREWNHLVGYDKPRNDAKLIHYTQGVPCFPETETSEHKDAWMKEFDMVRGATSWEELMGSSVHAAVVNGKKVPRFLVEAPQ